MEKHRLLKRQYLICFFTKHDYAPNVCTHCYKIKRGAPTDTNRVVVMIGGIEEVLSRVPRDGDVMHFGDGTKKVIRDV